MGEEEEEEEEEEVIVQFEREKERGEEGEEEERSRRVEKEDGISSAISMMRPEILESPVDAVKGPFAEGSVG